MMLRGRLEYISPRFSRRSQATFALFTTVSKSQRPHHLEVDDATPNAPMTGVCPSLNENMDP